MTGQLEALESLDLADWAPTRDEMWTLPAYHVDGLHPEVTRRLLRSLDVLTRGGHPLASVVRGERGSGKTHLLSWLREQIQARYGYFFPMKPVAGYSVWLAAVEDIFNGLLHPAPGARDQLNRLLTSLVEAMKLDPATERSVVGRGVLHREHVDAFIAGLRLLDREVGIQAADTARALVLTASSGSAVEIGRAYFARPESHDDARGVWGIAGPRPAQFVLRDLTRLIALGGPIVFAFDQLDGLVHESRTVLGSARKTNETASARRIRDDIATTLMELREESRRTLLVVACQVDTWKIVTQSSLVSARERFDLLPELGAIPDTATAAAIVGRRFGPRYTEVGFTPDYPTWPIAESALREAPHRFTARRLLMRVADHVTACLANRQVVELVTLGNPVAAPPKKATTVAESTEPPPGVDFAELTETFERLRAAAHEEPLLESVEDRTMPPLIGAGLRSVVHELNGDPHRFAVDEDFGPSAELHARLRYTVEDDTEQEIHWSFRTIAASHARAFQTRLAKAMIASGLAVGQPNRHLLLIRNTDFPGGPKTADMKADFQRRGGIDRVINAADIRTLSALRVMLEQHPPGLQDWLRSERPASKLEIFAELIGGIGVNRPATSTAATAVARSTAARPDDDIVVGVTHRGRRPFAIELAALRKHSIVIGSSGSGKTVLVKSIVEQCALRGVSAIVLDPNEDLASLGDPWPVQPEQWTADQQEQANRYFAHTEVVVWTPGMRNGRPISFHPLPDFGLVRDDPDDYRRLLDATVRDLAAQARVIGRSPRNVQQLSILTRALDHYVSDGGHSFSGFLDVLAELPDGIGNPRSGARLASEMAATLEAATDTDPLFGEGGSPVDPAVLLAPSKGRTARVSVISMIGLSDEARRSFVSRLQMALFAHFRANPVRDRSLGGLFVMDEAQIFVPAGAATPSTESTRMLIAQIRKYGLGMLLATQMPKGLHNSVLGNTANQFIGRLTAPAQLAAAEQMAQARGSTLDNVAKLDPGVFYAATEGSPFSRIGTPLCLSQHRDALTEEEVLERARR
ncbi:AAA family ATPase [Phytohabitans sp. ZYX-F-186]|uniref:AAA family ATPase n=1 Tax=Phytohabitans maris TaxID=3071409 RepID=A0ABU0ZAP6_9ACTN|nr:DUF87 domain-containing protein [Phytohabitans sp. ZYX-F-186]MDQ7903519.1 AAA family ATPase [Phytohabitans sp. ZYX-F-186]